MLLLHYGEVVNPTCDPIPYCGKSGLTRCEDAVVRHDGALFPPCYSSFFLFAAFPEGSSPRVASVSFGVETSTENLVLWTADNCGDGEIPGQEWPWDNTGTTVVWNSAQTAELLEVYVFSAYFYDGEEVPSTVAMTAHPILGGVFQDDSVPAVEDVVVDYGVLGLNTDGYLPPCPPGTSDAPEVATGTMLYLSPPTPNPSSGAFRFSIQLPADEHVSLKLHDAGGREVWLLHEGTMAAGVHELSFEEDLAPGVYFLTLQTATGQAATRIVRVESM